MIFSADKMGQLFIVYKFKNWHYEIFISPPPLLNEILSDLLFPILAHVINGRYTSAWLIFSLEPTHEYLQEIGSVYKMSCEIQQITAGINSHCY